MMTMSNRRIRHLGLGLALGLAAVLATAHLLASKAEAPGDLDTSFDGDGKLTTDILGDDEAVALAIQGDGKIIAVGTSDYYGAPDFAVVRYGTTGALDTSFGGDGVVTTTIGGNYVSAASVALQTDGKIVIAGTSGDYGTTALTLVRYYVTGTVDTGFGTSGIVTITPGTSHNYGEGVAVGSGGVIMLAGTTWTSDYDFVAARFDTGGTPDSTFNSTGVVTTDLGLWDFGHAMALQPDGKIIVAGRTGTTAGGYDIAMVRYRTDGALDPNFGAAGVVTTSVGDFDAAYAVEVQTDGKIVVAGIADGGELMVARYSDAGALDTSFSGDGVFTTTLCEEGLDVAIQPDGKIVVAGSTGTDPDRDFAVVRLSSRGYLDVIFAGGGVATLDFLAGDEAASAVAVQSNGKIVVAGTTEGAGAVDMALARYLGGSGYQTYLPLVLRGFY
jgi:uncharacterized delta-60 repeat protein